jgi:hypothetical protein
MSVKARIIFMGIGVISFTIVLIAYLSLFPPIQGHYYKHGCMTAHGWGLHYYFNEGLIYESDPGKQMDTIVGEYKVITHGPIPEIVVSGQIGGYSINNASMRVKLFGIYINGQYFLKRKLPFIKPGP